MPVLARFLILVLLPAGIALGLGYSVLFGGNSFQHLNAGRARLSSIQAQQAEVDAEIAAYRREVDQLRNDPATLRRAAAEELLLVPEGSVVFRFPR